MVDFFDEVGGRDLGELVSDGLFVVLRESAESLLDRLCSFFDIEGVPDHLSGDTRHVRGFPSEDVLVCPRKVTSAPSYLSSSSIPIRAVLVESDESSMIFLNSWSELILDLAAFLAGTSPSS